MYVTCISNIPPSSSTIHHVVDGQSILHSLWGKWFGQMVSHHFLRWYLFDRHTPILHHLTEKVMLTVDVLWTRLDAFTCRIGDCPSVFNEESCWVWILTEDFKEERNDPALTSIFYRLNEDGVSSLLGRRKMWLCLVWSLVKPKMYFFPDPVGGCIGLNKSLCKMFKTLRDWWKYDLAGDWDNFTSIQSIQTWKEVDVSLSSGIEKHHPDVDGQGPCAIRFQLRCCQHNLYEQIEWDIFSPDATFCPP